MEIDVFAGLPVEDYPAALEWYPLLLGDVETFDPNDTERVFTLGEHRYVYVVLDRERAGRGLVTLFVEDHDAFVEAASSRGVEPARQETYENGVRKTTYRDPEGNEIGIGGAPVA
jgi:2-hydroxychromene-2-carboxylate isomerase